MLFSRTPSLNRILTAPPKTLRLRRGIDSGKIRSFKPQQGAELLGPAFYPTLGDTDLMSLGRATHHSIKKLVGPHVQSRHQV